MQSLLGTPAGRCSAQPVAGGCIHAAWRLDTAAGRFFLKSSDAARAPMLEAEQDGLQALAAAQCVRVPQALGSGVHAGRAWLLLEWIQLGPLTESAARDLGAALAQLHQAPQQAFGWRRDNFIGATPQSNPQSRDWAMFWRQQRLAFQLRLAARGAVLERRVLERGERLCEMLPALFSGHEVRPSLLHGDLWGGNAGCDERGRPVIFDPAVYCGDRETDLAMTELFGGFPEGFHAAYREQAPLPSGHAQRRLLYQLYHVLNHANLFGGGYAAQAGRMINQLLGQVACG